MTDTEYIRLREDYAGMAMQSLLVIAAGDKTGASDLPIEEGLQKACEAAFVIGDAMAAEAERRRQIPPKR